MSEDKDPRGTCTRCQHMRGAWCVQAKAALLHHRDGRAEIGPALAGLMQHCPAFKERV